MVPVHMEGRSSLPGPYRLTCQPPLEATSQSPLNDVLEPSQYSLIGQVIPQIHHSIIARDPT
jgi:hypothetical protein